MTSLIILFGVLMLLAGMFLIIKPESLIGLLEKHIDKLGLHVLAVVVRLVLGVLLVSMADASKFPLAIEILGWIALAAALFLAVIGRARFRKIMAWALSVARPAARVGGVLAAGFGAFLVYAFI